RQLGAYLLEGLRQWLGEVRREQIEDARVHAADARPVYDVGHGGGEATLLARVRGVADLRQRDGQDAINEEGHDSEQNTGARTPMAVRQRLSYYDFCRPPGHFPQPP